MARYCGSALSLHLDICTWFTSILSTVSRVRGRSSFEEKSSTTCREVRYVSAQGGVQNVLATYLAVQALHARYSPCLLKRVNPDSGMVGYGLKLLVNVVQDLVVHLQRLDELLVRVL